MSYFFPGSECLDTNPYKGEVGIVMYTNTSIKVNLSETTWPVKCTNISHPAVRYTVYYRQLDDMKPNDDCQEDKSVCQSKVLTVTHSDMNCLNFGHFKLC
jgi:hypothetical protein